MGTWSCQGSWRRPISASCAGSSDRRGWPDTCVWYWAGGSNSSPAKNFHATLPRSRTARMIEPARLLAFAFAGADLLFEVNRDGMVLFATGAITGFSDGSELKGTYPAEVFRKNERARFTIIVRGLSAGERVGPLTMTLASGDKATLSMCYLAQNNRISCALARRGNRATIAGLDAETGLVDRGAFLSAAGEKIGGESAMALVNVANLNEICASLSPEAAASLMAAIGTNLKGMEGGVAA